jgi:hypothetical protein
VTGTIVRDAFQDTFVDESSSTSIRGCATELRVKDPGEDRSLIEFDVSDINANCTISIAEVSLLVTRDDTLDLVVYRITQSWDDATTHWDNQPTFNLTVYDSFNTSSTGPITITITSLVQGWVDGSFANHGLIIVAVNNSGEVKFSSIEGSTAPSIKVDYGP